MTDKIRMDFNYQEKLEEVILKVDLHADSHKEVIAKLRAELDRLRKAHSETELNSINEIMRLGAALDQTTGERDALRTSLALELHKALFRRECCA